MARLQYNNPKIPTWAAYNSTVSPVKLPLTIVTMMPLLAAPIYPQHYPKANLSTLLLTIPIFQRTLLTEKTLLHATAMVVFQRKTDYSPELSLDHTKHPTCKSLPSSSIPNAELLLCHVPSNAQPKCPQYGRLDTTPSSDVTDAAGRDDLAWSVGQSMARLQCNNPKIPTWAAYNSTVSPAKLPLTIVAMMPLLAAPAQEWSTMLTVLKQAQNIGEGHTPVITFDLQLYEKAVKLQMHTVPALDHLVFWLGEMHTVMAALRALGSSIEDSGFDDAWVEAGIYGSTTKQQILEGNHMKRALTAHSMTYSNLCDLHVEAFLKTEKEESGANFPSMSHASYTMNASSQEGKYGAFGKHHQEILKAMESGKFKEKKSKTASGVVALKDDRALFARFLVVVLSRPEIDLKESISEFELAAFPRVLFNSDGDLCHWVGKSKLMSILESSLPDQRTDQEEDRRQHAGKSVVIIDGTAVISPVIFLRSSTIGPRNVTRSTSFLIVMTFQILSSREFASFAKVATGPWCTKSPVVQSSKRSLSSSC